MNNFKKYTILSVILLFVSSISSFAVITGSGHDFKSNSWSNNEICLPCHAPHNNLNASSELLWNHNPSSATYTIYSSPTMDASAPSAISSVSKTCLSCHDGTIALDSYHGAPTPSTSGTISGNANLGTALTNDHPISIAYSTTDAGLRATTYSTGITGKATVADLLYNSKLECSSCHDVHNEYGQSKLLVKSNAQSALCLTCHSK